MFIDDSIDSIAFENFFQDYCSQQPFKGINWGPDYWEKWGVYVEDSRVKFNNDTDRAFFLLSWL